MKYPFVLARQHFNVSFFHTAMVLRVRTSAPIVPGSDWVPYVALQLPRCLPGASQWLPVAQQHSCVTVIEQYVR